jgi:hypothetical protein
MIMNLRIIEWINRESIQFSPFIYTHDRVECVLYQWIGFDICVVCGQKILGAWVGGVLCRQNRNYTTHNFSFQEQNDQGFPAFLQNIAVPILCGDVFTGISTPYTYRSHSERWIEYEATIGWQRSGGLSNRERPCVYRNNWWIFFVYKYLLSHDTLRIFGGWSVTH